MLNTEVPKHVLLQCSAPTALQQYFKQTAHRSLHHSKRIFESSEANKTHRVQEGTEGSMLCSRQPRQLLGGPEKGRLAVSDGVSGSWIDESGNSRW